MQQRLQRLERKTQQSRIPLARAIRDTDFNSTATQTKYPFSGVEFDTDQMWSVSEPTRLTVRQPGVYLITANAFWPSGAPDPLANIAKNGLNGFAWNRTAASTLFPGLCPSTVLKCDAGDFLELEVASSGGGSHTMPAGFTSLAVSWLGVG